VLTTTTFGKGCAKLFNNLWERLRQTIQQPLGKVAPNSTFGKGCAKFNP